MCKQLIHAESCWAFHPPCRRFPQTANPLPRSEYRELLSLSDGWHAHHSTVSICQPAGVTEHRTQLPLTPDEGHCGHVVISQLTAISLRELYGHIWHSFSKYIIHSPHSDMFSVRKYAHFSDGHRDCSRAVLCPHATFPHAMHVHAKVTCDTGSSLSSPPHYNPAWAALWKVDSTKQLFELEFPGCIPWWDVETIAVALIAASTFPVQNTGAS